MSRTQEIALFTLNPGIDRGGAAERYRRQKRVQIRDLLTDEAAAAARRVLAEETPWGLAWRAGAEGPHALRAHEVRALTAAERSAIGEKVARAMAAGDYAFLYGQYRMLDSYLEGWGESEGLARLLEHINDAPFLDLVREVTGLPGLIKADAQATFYGPTHFLARHDDSHVADGWRVAYVLNFCDEDWRPDWGGYLFFYDEAGDVVAGYRPRFNALNLFAVPQRHAVGYVAPFCAGARLGISGWFREY